MVKTQEPLEDSFYLKEMAETAFGNAYQNAINSGKQVLVDKNGKLVAFSKNAQGEIVEQVISNSVSNGWVPIPTSILKRVRK